jgi:hypothetical protein
MPSLPLKINSDRDACDDSFLKRQNTIDEVDLDIFEDVKRNIDGGNPCHVARNRASPD